VINNMCVSELADRAQLTSRLRKGGSTSIIPTRSMVRDGRSQPRPNSEKSIDLKTPERERESCDAFEDGRLMLGGICEAQNLAEDVPYSAIPYPRVADRDFGVCDSSGLPRSGMRRSSCKNEVGKLGRGQPYQ
jgi:hypothetical protein